MLPNGGKHMKRRSQRASREARAARRNVVRVIHAPRGIEIEVRTPPGDEYTAAMAGELADLIETGIGHYKDAFAEAVAALTKNRSDK